MARTIGAKGKNNKYNIPKMIRILRKYTETHDYPILKECCLENGWSYNYFIDLQRKNEELCTEARRLLDLKEVKLEKALLTGQNNTGVIFALKQLGWKDNPEPIIVNNTIQNNVGGNRSDVLKNVSAETLEDLDDILDELDKEETENSEPGNKNSV